MVHDFELSLERERVAVPPLNDGRTVTPILCNRYPDGLAISGDTAGMIAISFLNFDGSKELAGAKIKHRQVPRSCLPVNPREPQAITVNLDALNVIYGGVEVNHLFGLLLASDLRHWN
jgi:hypothetical protein